MREMFAGVCGVRVGVCHLLRFVSEDSDRTERMSAVL
jgi:predicted patatin/cPLA2 family phospholipase